MSVCERDRVIMTEMRAVISLLQLVWSSSPSPSSIVFFFPFVLFFVVTAIRIKTWGGDKDMFFFLTPLLLFFAMCLSAVATRAYASSNESTPHYLAEHVLISVAPPVLLEVALQLYGLLSKRALPGGWIDASSLFLRFLNVIALVLYAVGAGATVSCE